MNPTTQSIATPSSLGARYIFSSGAPRRGGIMASPNPSRHFPICGKPKMSKGNPNPEPRDAL